MTTVSIARCASYDQEAVRGAWDALLEPLGGLASYVKRGDTVLLKPNLVTHADVVECLCKGDRFVDYRFLRRHNPA